MDINPRGNGYLILQVESIRMGHIDMVVLPVETVCAVRLSISVLSESRAEYLSVIAVSTYIRCVSTKRIIGHQSIR